MKLIDQVVFWGYIHGIIGIVMGICFTIDGYSWVEEKRGYMYTAATLLSTSLAFYVYTFALWLANFQGT